MSVMLFGGGSDKVRPSVHVHFGEGLGKGRPSVYILKEGKIRQRKERVQSHI